MFHTKLPNKKSKSTISHLDKIFLIGSCFTENIGKKLTEFQFKTYSNPFGILYNPVSIFRNLNKIIAHKEYKKEDLFFFNEQWHSFDHHSSFSNPDIETCLAGINSEIEKVQQELKTTNCCFVSLGTAWIHIHSTSNKIVGNCHKIPNKEFSKSLLSINEIVEEATSSIEKIRSLNPNIKFIFTVSPIRHLKDGFHENQLSKSTLLLAIDKLQKELTDISYFPSYELMMDDLRDYRFYEYDMIHPSIQAIQYIWENFSSYYFDSKTQNLNTKIGSINDALKHRAFNPNSEAYRNFKKSIEKNSKELESEYPFLNFKIDE